MTIAHPELLLRWANNNIWVPLLIWSFYYKLFGYFTGNLGVAPLRSYHFSTKMYVLGTHYKHISKALLMYVKSTLQRRYNAVVRRHAHWPRYTWSALYRTWQPHPRAPLQFPPVIMRYYILHVCYIACSFFMFFFNWWNFVHVPCLISVLLF